MLDEQAARDFIQEITIYKPKFYSRVRNHVLDEKLNSAPHPPPLLKCLAAGFRLVAEIPVGAICFTKDSSQGFIASWRVRIQEGARLYVCHGDMTGPMGMASSSGSDLGSVKFAASACVDGSGSIGWC